MKRKQVAAILLSTILAFSGCVPATGIGVYAAENAAAEAVETATVYETAETDALSSGNVGESVSGENAGAAMSTMSEGAVADPEAVSENEAAVADDTSGAYSGNPKEETGGPVEEEVSEQEETVKPAEEEATEQEETEAPAEEEAVEQEETVKPAEEEATEQEETVKPAEEEISEQEETEAPVEEEATAQEETVTPVEEEVSEQEEAVESAEEEASEQEEAVESAEEEASEQEEAVAPVEEEVSEQEETVESAEEEASEQEETVTPVGEEVSEQEEAEELVEEVSEQEDAEAPVEEEATAQEEGGITEDGPQETVKENAAGDYKDDPTGDDFANAAEITVGAVVDVSVTKDTPAFFRFTPAEVGRYIIYSTGSDCNPGMILHSGDNSIISSADDEDGSNFRFAGNLDANTEYFIQAYCYDEQAEFQLHLEKSPFHAEAAGGINQYHLKKGDSQTLQVNAAAAEGEEISYCWRNSSGSDLTNYSEDPASFTVGNIQSYTEILCIVSDESGNTVDIWFYLYVDDIISAWPEGCDFSQNSYETRVEQGDSIYLIVNYRTGIQDCTIVWYDEDDRVIQDNSSNSYELTDVQENRTIRCRVADAENPDNYADVYFYIKLQVDFYVYPEGNTYDNPETTIDIAEKNSVTLHTMVQTSGSTEGITYKWETSAFNKEEWVEIPDCQGDTFEISMPKKARCRCTAKDADGNEGTARFNLVPGYDAGLSVCGYDWEGNETDASEIVLDANEAEGAYELSVIVYTGVEDRLSYQWYKDTGNGEEIIDGATGSAYTVDSPQNGTRYICVVDNGYGDGPRTLTYIFRYNNRLIVSVDDTKSGDTAEIDIRDYNTYTMTPCVTAEDTKGLTYKWEQYNESTGEYVPTGDTSSSLTIDVPANRCTYACTVTDSYGNSAIVWYYFRADTHLRLYAAGDPSKRDSFYINITGKETLTLNAVAEADKGTALTYEWQKLDEYGDPHGIDGASGTLTGGGPLTLQLSTLSAGDSYVCRIMDEYNNEAALFFHLVTQTPSWSIYPRGASEGEDTAVIGVAYRAWAHLIIGFGIIEADSLYYTWKTKTVKSCLPEKTLSVIL